MKSGIDWSTFSKAGISIQGNQQDLNSFISSNLKLAQQESEKNNARLEVSRLLSEFKNTKSSATLSSAAALISYYGFDSGELDSAIEEAKKAGYIVNVVNIDVAVLKQLVVYDVFIASLQPWDKEFKKIDEFTKASSEMLAKIDDDAVKADEMLKKLLENHTNFSLEANFEKISELNKHIASAKELRDNAVQNKSDPRVIEQITNRIQTLEKKIEKVAERLVIDYHAHNLRTAHTALDEDVPVKDKMKNVKVEDEHAKACEHTVKAHFVSKLSDFDSTYKKADIMAAQKNLIADAMKIKADFMKHSASNFQSLNASKAENLAGIAASSGRPADQSVQQPQVGNQSSQLYDEVAKHIGARQEDALVRIVVKRDPNGIDNNPNQQGQPAVSQASPAQKNVVPSIENLSVAAGKQAVEVAKPMAANMPHQEVDPDLAAAFQKSKKQVVEKQESTQASQNIDAADNDIRAAFNKAKKNQASASKEVPAANHKHQDRLNEESKNDQSQIHIR